MYVVKNMVRTQPEDKNVQPSPENERSSAPDLTVAPKPPIIIKSGQIFDITITSIQSLGAGPVVILPTEMFTLSLFFLE